MPMSKNQVRFLVIDLKRAGYHDAAFDEENDRIVPIPENSDLWMNGGGVCFKEGASPKTRELAHGPMADIYMQTKEMLRGWNSGRTMEIADVRNFRSMAEFGDVVLAARDDGPHGLHFVTWDYDPGHTGVSHGHYTTSYVGAKEDFATRAGLISPERLFEPAEMALIYRALKYQDDEDIGLSYADELRMDGIYEKVQRQCFQAGIALAGQATEKPMLVQNDAFAVDCEDIKLFGKPALFTHSRIDHTTVPDGFYAYDLRHGDDGEPSTVEPHVHVNHAGTVITKEPLEIGMGDYLYLGTPGSDDYALNFMGASNNLDEFQYQHTPVEEAPQLGQQM